MNAAENHKIIRFAEMTQIVRVRCAAAGGALFAARRADR